MSELDDLEVVALRKLLWRMAGDECDDPDEHTVLEAANAAVDRLEDLEERVAELEEVVDPDPGTTAYEQLTKDQKVHRVRVALLEQVMAGKSATMVYDDVVWLFDGKPSAGHAYDLMELAAEADGYIYETGGHGKGQKRIRVIPDSVNDERVIHAANNGSGATPA